MKLLAKLAAVPDPDHDDPLLRINPVAQDVSTGTEGGEHFPSSAVVVHGPTEIREVAQLTRGGLDAHHCVPSGNWTLFGEEIVQPFDIVQRIRQPNYRRHDLRLPVASSSSHESTFSLEIASPVAA